MVVAAGFLIGKRSNLYPWIDERDMESGGRGLNKSTFKKLLGIIIELHVYMLCKCMISEREVWLPFRFYMKWTIIFQNRIEILKLWFWKRKLLTISNHLSKFQILLCNNNNARYIITSLAINYECECEFSWMELQWLLSNNCNCLRNNKRHCDNS